MRGSLSSLTTLASDTAYHSFAGEWRREHPDETPLSSRQPVTNFRALLTTAAITVKLIGYSVHLGVDITCRAPNP